MWWRRKKKNESRDMEQPDLSAQLAGIDKAVARLARENTKANMLWEQSLKQQAELVDNLKMTLLQRDKDQKTLLDLAEARGQRQSEQRIFPQLLAFLDELMQAASAMEQEAAKKPAFTEWAAGIRRLHNQGEELLQIWNVTPVPATGHPFDPRVHHPIEVTTSNEVSRPTVVGELQRGYHLQGELLRLATVVVAKPAETTIDSLEAST